MKKLSCLKLRKIANVSVQIFFLIGVTISTTIYFYIFLCVVEKHVVTFLSTIWNIDKTCRNGTKDYYYIVLNGNVLNESWWLLLILNKSFSCSFPQVTIYVYIFSVEVIERRLLCFQSLKTYYFISTWKNSFYTNMTHLVFFEAYFIPLRLIKISNARNCVC